MSNALTKIVSKIQPKLKVQSKINVIVIVIIIKILKNITSFVKKKFILKVHIVLSIPLSNETKNLYS